MSQRSRSPLPLATSLSSGRFSIVRKLGQGGMGLVYEAFDALRKQRIALKTLASADPAAVYQLKNEFRTLRGLRHPNLVDMYELFARREAWFFTMELVEGQRFDEWVRPHGVLDERRLRSALEQLTCGVQALHLAGKVHRDLKPSNVLVDGRGRVIILDFGLSGSLDVGSVGQTVAPTSIIGTPEYMAPEQASGQAATTASDVYAIGVMLFEALVGRLPFEGSVHSILAQKLMHPVPTSLLSRNLPSDLAATCAQLLVRAPEARLDVHALSARLASHIARRPRIRQVRPVQPAPRRAAPSAELASLHAAYRAARDGTRPVVVLRTGGESRVRAARLEPFLRGLREQGQAVVLSATCSARESLPLKGLDGLVDDLSRHLRKQDPLHLAGLIPRDADALRQVFPVMGRIEAIAQAPVRPRCAASALRRRACSALGELLGRIRDRQPLVISIDNLQRSDASSIQWLLRLLRRRDAAPLLLIVSHGSDAVAGHPALQPLYVGLEAGSRIEVRRLGLGSARESSAGRQGAAIHV